MIARFFIDRPVFASVLSIAITLVGGIALANLPIAEFPTIAPPTVQVDCTYPGASADVVVQSVATPIEQQVNGVENMLYMESRCTNDGAYNLTVTFKHGVDLNMAQVLVQNRVALAVPLLPDVLKQTGVTVKKKSPDILLVIALNSTDGRYDQLYLSNYALLHIKDELARMPGVADVILFGQRDYSMRVWVDPEKLAARNLSAGDVAAAIREQNIPVASGQLGQPTGDPGGPPTQLPLSVRGRMIEAEEFGDIIIKRTPGGRILRLRDVARIELGAKNQDINAKVSGKATVGLAVFQLPDANALKTADMVKAKVDDLRKDFPEGMEPIIRYDTTPFIRESISEVFKTLRDSILLVALVVLLFLQNWRSAVIPLLTVPVAIVGTFGAMAALGFSLNNLTLFGLVLAIGIVVDDAIVVVEAVEQHIEHGLAPREATIRALDEVSGPVIAIGLVLTAIFLPCAIISGVVGQFFRQFALTIAVSTIISAFNSLSLSPALAAVLLRPHSPDTDKAPMPRVAFALLGGLVGWFLLAPELPTGIAWLSATGFGRAVRHLLGPVLAPHLQALVRIRLEWLAGLAGVASGWALGPLANRLLGGGFTLFNAAFRRITRRYGSMIGGLLRQTALVLTVYAGLLVVTYGAFTRTPTGFIPSQDMGYLLINVQLPDATSLERTQAVMDRIEKMCLQVDGVRYTQTITGQSLLLSANGTNFGTMIIILDEFALRRTPERYGDAIRALLQQRLNEEVTEAVSVVMGPPPVRGVGRAGGFKLMIEDRGDHPPQMLQEETENVVAKANGPDGQRPDGQRALLGLISVFRANVPQLYADVNRAMCLSSRVSLQDLFDTLRIYLGSLYVNDFNRFGRTWQVIVQADAPFRTRVEDVRLLKVRNSVGSMVPVASLADLHEKPGPLILTRYNMYPAAPINGAAAPGYSSGDAIRLMEQISRRELPQTMSFEWTDMAYLELQAGNTAMIVFGFAVAMVFLVLAAQYESWSLPLAVILVVPLCLLSAVIGVRLSQGDINIFTQIGFVVLVGLASKNAILIVEFAKSKREAGMARRQATLEACTQRFRPIVMTSLAFILGVLPLVLSQGAGAEMRRTLGTTVFSGMLGVTMFGVLLTPVFFFVIDWLGATALFTTPLVRRTSDLALGVLSGRFLRPPLARILRPPAPVLRAHVPAPLPPDAAIEAPEAAAAHAEAQPELIQRG